MAESEVVEAFPSAFRGAAEDVGEEADAGLLVGAEVGLYQTLLNELDSPVKWYREEYPGGLPRRS